MRETTKTMCHYARVNVLVLFKLYDVLYLRNIYQQW
jgi:hypothetical protein